MIKKDRYCGVLLHPTSFASPYGIGDLGQEARKCLEKLASYGIKLWQILPLGPTGYGNSPYAARSSFAGNELLIDLRQIPGFSFEDTWADPSARIDYDFVYKNKMNYLKTSAINWYRENSNDSSFLNFCKEHSWWLDDYALFQSLTQYFNDSRWFLWPKDIRDRENKAVEHYESLLSESIATYKTLQYFFFSQWNSLHEFANKLGIKIIGDMPFFCAGDSADVWTNRKLFKIDSQGRQKAQAGVPPDAFSSTGQLWGNPVYNWNEHKKDNYKWYRKRVEMTLKMVDIVRIDHFRGLQSYWEVPSGSPDASYGKWEKSPGMELVNYFKNYSIIAEDLGVITPQVEKLLEESCFPGMKVLQFAFDLWGDHLNSENYYLPYNYNYNCVAYTGTHDNNTSRGWFDSLSDNYKDIVRQFFQSPNEDIVWQMIRALLASTAKYVIIPLQDIVGYGEEARMNAPSTVGNLNWSWRMNPSHLQDWMLNRLHQYISLYGR